MGGSDGFLMVRVKDRELASTKVNAALRKLGEVMASKGQPLNKPIISIKKDQRGDSAEKYPDCRRRWTKVRDDPVAWATGTVHPGTEVKSGDRIPRNL